MRGIFCNFFSLSTRDLFSENHSGKETFFKSPFFTGMKTSQYVTSNINNYT